MKTKFFFILTIIYTISMSLFLFIVKKDYSQMNVDVYETTSKMEKLMSRESSINFRTYKSSSELEKTGITFEVDTNSKKQDFYGYGAALTHSSAYLLSQEGAEDVSSEILNELFSEDGAHLRLVRIPIGSSDYSNNEEYFTCDDLENVNYNDYSLRHFSISHDRNIINVLKKIITINPDIQIFACPWSAPAWMKTNGSLFGGELKEKCYNAYVDYLIRFVEAYKEEGININYLSLVNEPLVNNLSYPHMNISSSTAVKLMKKLKNLLKIKELDVNILGWEHNVDETSFEYANTIFESNFDGFAYHGYGSNDEYKISDGCKYIYENYKDKSIFMTEITEHTGSNDFANNLSYAGKYVTIDPLNYGLNGLMYWNLVLRKDGTPSSLNNEDNKCYGVIDMDFVDGEYYYYKRSSYYAMAHISKFAYPINGVYPSVLNVTSNNNSNIIISALKRVDGTIVVCAFNSSSKLSETIHLIFDEKSITYEIKPESIVTFVTNNGNNSSLYNSYSISHIDIIQKSVDKYEYIVESDIIPSNSTKVYISPYNQISSDMKPVEYSIMDGKYVFTNDTKYDFYFIHIVDENKNAIMSVTKPQMAPSLQICDSSKVLSYNFFNGTSWSSFCDESGKAVYRSSKSKFDENATLIKENINMLGEDETIDNNPNKNEPYYFVIISSKKGIIRFISSPIMTNDELYSSLLLDLKLIDDLPYLVVKGNILVDDSITVELSYLDLNHGIINKIKSEEILGKKDESFIILLDITEVLSIKNGSKVLYDIKLLSNNGAFYEFNINNINILQTLLYDNIKFEFKIRNETVKLMFTYNPI